MKKQKFMKREIDESMLIDFLAGRLDRSEQAMVEEWYDESEQNKKTLEDIYYISFLCDCADVVKNVDVEYSLRQLRKRVAENERRAKSRFPILLRRIAAYGAAAMVIVALSVAVLKQASERARFEEVYAENSTVDVALPDGSMARLQPDSRITYPVHADGREKYEVDIEGEARFEVVKQTNGRSFVVKALETRVVVRGTSFDVHARQDDDLITAVLHSGAINFVAGDRVVEISPNQRVAYTRTDGNIQVSEVNTERSFAHEDLAEVIKVIAGMYGCEIRLDDASLGQIKFTGTVSRDNELGHTMNVITLTTGTRFRLEGDTVVIHK